MGGCGRRRPIGKSHRLRVCGEGSPPRKPRGRGPAYPRILNLCWEGAGHPPPPSPCTGRVWFPWQPPLSAPLPVRSGKMGVACSTGENLRPPPRILLPGEATGREAESGPACKLPPTSRGSPVTPGLQPGRAWPPGSSGCGEGRRPSAAIRTARGDLESHPFGPAGGGPRPFQACPPGCDSSSSTPASPEI